MFTLLDEARCRIGRIIARTALRLNVFLTVVVRVNARGFRIRWCAVMKHCRLGAFAQAITRCYEDLNVNKCHDNERNKERSHCTVDDKAGLVCQSTVVCGWIVQRSPAAVVPAQQRRHRNDDADEPHDEDGQHDALVRPLLCVVNRVVYGVVAIDGDGAKVQNGRGTHQDVKC